MSSVELLESIQTRPEIAPAAIRSILLATDAETESDDAFALARVLTDATGAAVQIGSVLIPPRMMTLAFESPPDLTEKEIRRACDSRIERVRDQRTRGPSGARHWPIAVLRGSLGSTLNRLAHEGHADVIVTGRGRHGVVARLLGEEHLLGALRAVDKPVLAVEPEFTTRPRRVVIATDFSTQSERAARLALPLLDPAAAIYLVHVKTEPPVDAPRPEQWAQAYDQAIRGALERMRATLGAAETVAVECVELRGRHPGLALAEFAVAADADLIVVGAQGAGFLSRLIIGSVTTHLVRVARCSVFIAPPVREVHGVDGAQTWSRSLVSAEWPARIEGFMAAHRGRPVTVTTRDSVRALVHSEEAGQLLGAERDGFDWLIDVGVDGRVRGTKLDGVIAVRMVSDDAGTEHTLEIEHMLGTTAVVT